jgi:anaphase-promoting complex subunit 8
LFQSRTITKLPLTFFDRVVRFFPHSFFIDKSSTPLNSNIPNPYRQQLVHELLDAYEKDQLDAFGLHVFGMVLKEATIGTGGGRATTSSSNPPLPPDTPTAQAVLIQSILQFPYNWSAWLDLAEIVLYNDSNPTMGRTTNTPTSSGGSSNDDNDDESSGDGILGTASKHQHHHQHRLIVQRQQVERDIEEQLQPELAGHFMYHFFCAHLQAERQSHSDALAIYERWMDPLLFQGSPYLLSQYAVCSYHTRQFATAKSLLEDLHNHMPYRLDCMDVYSNILYVQEDSVALSQLAHTAVHVDKYRAETCCIVGNYYSLKQQRAKAIQYFQRAIKIDPTFTSAWTLMGHEYVEWKQTANAMAAYRRAVQVAPSDYRAWYGLGQTYELLNMNLYALYYYKQATQLRPYDARMWCAVGMTYTHLQRYNDAIRAYERAIQEDDTEGIATQKLATLYKKQHGQEEKAAACYWRHLEIRHLVTNTGTATSASPRHNNNNNNIDDGTLSGNNTSDGPESLEKMLHGIYIESTEAEAILFLANYHRKHGQYEIAAV